MNANVNANAAKVANAAQIVFVLQTKNAATIALAQPTNAVTKSAAQKRSVAIVANAATAL